MIARASFAHDDESALSADCLLTVVNWGVVVDLGIVGAVAFPLSFRICNYTHTNMRIG